MRGKLIGFSLAIVSLLAGCGSGAEGTSRAEYIERADQICARQNRNMQREISSALAEVERLPMPIGSARDVSKILIPGLVKELQELRSIAPPANDKKEIAEFLAAIRLMISRMANSPPYVAKAPRPFVRTELMAKRYGFKVCGHV